MEGRTVLIVGITSIVLVILFAFIFIRANSPSSTVVDPNSTTTGMPITATKSPVLTTKTMSPQGTTTVSPQGTTTVPPTTQVVRGIGPPMQLSENKLQFGTYIMGCDEGIFYIINRTSGLALKMIPIGERIEWSVMPDYVNTVDNSRPDYLQTYYWSFGCNTQEMIFQSRLTGDQLSIGSGSVTVKRRGSPMQYNETYPSKIMFLNNAWNMSCSEYGMSFDHIPTSKRWYILASMDSVPTWI